MERINTNESNFYELCKEKSHLKDEIDNLKKVNDERVKVIEKLTSENVALKNTQVFSNQEITEEFKDFINNEVKAWIEEKEKDKISFKEIFEQQEMESKVRMEKEVIKVLKTNENIVRHSREKK